MFLQAITIDDRAYEVEKASKSFINTHIFPGGCLPSLEVIHRCIAGETDLRTVWLDDITEHYAETLRRWRETFVASAEARRGAGLRPALPAHVGALPRLRGGRLPRGAASATSRWCWPSPSDARSADRRPSPAASRLNIRSEIRSIRKPGPRLG